MSYFISSLPPKVREHARHLRNHWHVENTLHHTLDVTFAEDAGRIRKGSGSEITSVFRRLALSILKSDTTIKDNIRGKRRTAGWNLNKMKDMCFVENISGVFGWASRCDLRFTPKRSGVCAVGRPRSVRRTPSLLRVMRPPRVPATLE